MLLNRRWAAEILQKQLNLGQGKAHDNKGMDVNKPHNKCSFSVREVAT